MNADFDATRSLPYEVSARDLLPKPSIAKPPQHDIDRTKADESLRLRVVRKALVTGNKPVFSDAQDREVFFGCLVANADELARIIGANLSRGNIRILDVLVRAGLRPSAEVLCSPVVVESLASTFGKELLKPEQATTMREAFCNLVLGMTAHSEEVREQFVAAIRKKERFVWALNVHLSRALDRYLLLPPLREFGPVVQILGQPNVNEQLRDRAKALIDSGNLQRYFRDKAGIAANQLRELFLDGERSGHASLGHTA